MNTRVLASLTCLTLLVFSVACDSEQTADGADEASASSASSGSESESKPADESPPPKQITIEPKGNKMAFATTELTAKPGQKIKLTLNNTATDSAMKHNFALLDTMKTEKARKVAKTGWENADGGFRAKHDLVLAQTDTADPGEKVEVTFTVPEEPGKYMYICTYPGHFPKMKGTLVVEK